MKNQNGFSLIELLVAVAISFVAVLAASEAYLSSKQTNRLQAIQSRLTEDGRFGLSMLQRTISQAGYRASPNALLKDDRIGVAGNAITVRFTADGANHIVCDGSVPALDAAQTLVISRSNASALQCVTNGSVTPVNWIAPSATGSGTGTELVDFYVLMGLDTGPTDTPLDYRCVTEPSTKVRDCVVDKYAATLTAGTETADQIVAVRVCLVLRSQATDASITRSSNVQNCSNAEIANSQNDNKMYRRFTTTVLLRNR